MKKKLLLSFVAAAFSVASFADDYVYTPDARLKVDANVPVEGYATTASTDGWNIVSTSESSVADIVSCENDALVFQTSTAANGLIYTTAPISTIGTYVVSFKISNPTTTFTTVAGTAADLNRIVLAATSKVDGDLCDIVQADGDTLVYSSSTFNVNANEQTFAIALATTDSRQDKLVFILNSLAEGTVVSDIKIVKADAVYDTRNFKKVIDYANLLLGVPEFAAGESTESFKSDYVTLMQNMYDNADNDPDCILDDEANAQTYIEDFTKQQNAWLNETSEDMAPYLTAISDTAIAKITKINRGDNTAMVKYFPNLQLDGGNWQHPSGASYLYSAIQNGYSNSAVYNAYNTNLPKGKYFFYASVCNASTGKSSTYVYTYDLATTCKIFVGTEAGDSANFELPATSDYTAAYKIGEIKEDGAFRAGISWPGKTSGGAFFITNVAVRYIGSGATDEITRKTTFESGFMTQYNTAVSNRNKTLNEIATPTAELKWGRDTLQKAEDKWAPFINKPFENNWLTGVEDSKTSITYANDSKVATNEELEAWKVLQGVFTEEDTVGMSKTLCEYPIVRGYQYALNYVTNLNKVITNTKDIIAAAKVTRDDAMNATGDKETYNTAITTAENDYKALLAKTTDATMDADSASFAAIQTTLNDATAAFKKSAKIDPIVDIDFENGWTPIIEMNEDEGLEETVRFEIQGTAGKAVFATSQVQCDADGNPENTTNGTLYQLGYAGENVGVLHMGASSFYVPLENVDATNDVLKVEYDMYIGNLTGKSFWYTLTNTEDNTLTWGTNTLGGFMYNKYNNSTTQNTIFANEDGTLNSDLIYGVSGYGSSAVSNNGICVEANRTHFTIVYDLKVKTVKASWETSFTNGIASSSKTGYETAMPALEDMTPRALLFGTNYSTAARNCWLDNIVVYKYASTATAGKKGDVNGDGNVDINDVNAVINVICGGTEYQDKADVTSDGNVDINDVNTVIGVICGE